MCNRILCVMKISNVWLNIVHKVFAFFLDDFNNTSRTVIKLFCIEKQKYTEVKLLCIFH